MHDPDTRLGEVERRLRRMGGIVGMLACGWLITLVWLLAPRPRIDAREFAVRDSAGVRRAALMVRDDGCPAIRLDDRAGRPRLYGVVLPDGNPRLRFTDSLGVHRLVVELDEGTHARIRLAGADGHTRAQLYLTEESWPILELGWGEKLRVITPTEGSGSLH